MNSEALIYLIVFVTITLAFVVITDLAGLSSFKRKESGFTAVVNYKFEYLSNKDVEEIAFLFGKLSLDRWSMFEFSWVAYTSISLQRKIYSKTKGVITSSNYISEYGEIVFIIQNLLPLTYKICLIHKPIQTLICTILIIPFIFIILLKPFGLSVDFSRAKGHFVGVNS